jgi:hypothetical protein
MATARSKAFATACSLLQKTDARGGSAVYAFRLCVAVPGRKSVVRFFGPVQAVQNIG